MLDRYPANIGNFRFTGANPLAAMLLGLQTKHIHLLRRGRTVRWMRRIRLYFWTPFILQGERKPPVLCHQGSYLVLDINTDGGKDLHGIWMADTRALSSGGVSEPDRGAFFLVLPCKVFLQRQCRWLLAQQRPALTLSDNAGYTSFINDQKSATGLSASDNRSPRPPLVCHRPSKPNRSGSPRSWRRAYR